MEGKVAFAGQDWRGCEYRWGEYPIDVNLLVINDYTI